VTATKVTIVEPTLFGRVTAIGNGTFTLVGSDGQLLTVTTTGATRYDTVTPGGSGPTPATASAVAVGDRVRAEGAQDTLTHLSADLITVGPARGTPPTSSAPGADPQGPPPRA